MAEEAAAALYCLAACRLVDRAAHRAGDYLLRVPQSHNVVYAVIATALFGGELKLRPAERSDMPVADHVFEVAVPVGGHQLESEFERAAYIALFRNDRDATTDSLDAGPLKPDRRAALIARLRTLRRIHRVSFALVLRGIADDAPLRRFAAEQQAPILVPDDAAAALLLIEPATLNAQILEFWRELREIRPAEPQESSRQTSATAKGASDMPKSGISIVTGDGATIALSTGSRSPAHAERHDGADPVALRHALQELAEALKAQPSSEADQALASQIEAAKDELDKPKPDTDRVRKALDTVDETVKKGAGILEGGERIAGLLFRAYKHLSSFLELPG